MKIERRMVPAGKCEARVDDAGKKITGYGSVFYDGTAETEYRFWDIVERILPGAFDTCLPTSDVRGLYNHDPNQVLGRKAAGTLELSIDARGLLYSIDPPASPVGVTVVEALRRRDVTGSSFAFTVADNGQRWTQLPDGTFLREIVEIEELFDVGPVTYPAYAGTESALRSIGERENFDRFKATAKRAEYGESPLAEAYRRAALLRGFALQDLRG